MKTKTWIFNDNSNTAVITSKNILYRNSPILTVSHDDDGMWQFLDGDLVKEEDARIISLQEVLEIDFSIAETLDLPLGWVAWRDKKDGDWRKHKKASINENL